MDKIMDLMEIAEELIHQYLPENYEMDDCSWNERGFQICVFDVSSIESSMRGPVDRYRFFLSDDEEESMERFNDTIQKFAESFR